LYLIQQLFLHYLGNAEQAEYVLKSTKNVKNISDIIKYNLRKDYQILTIFNRNVLIQPKGCSSFHLAQCVLLHYPGKAKRAKCASK